MEEQIFKKFIKEMNDALERNLEQDGRDQESMLRDLFNYEERFRSTLTSLPQGREIYRQFMQFIMEDKGNILSARSYFRERQDTFSKKIAPAFHQDKPHLLYKFAINYPFVKWVMDRYKGPKKRSLSASYRKISEIRKKLCENNLPLAINRAKIFWVKVHNSPVEYMDLIQSASEGLINAIDKFVPPYRDVFKSVMIGRATLNMITEHSASAVKLSSNDKRILYRANNAKTKEGLTNQEDVLDYVNETFKTVSPQKLNEIINATSSTASLNQEIGEENQTLADTIPCDEETPEDILINNNLRVGLFKILKNLSPLAMKVIRLKFGIAEKDE